MPYASRRRTFKRRYPSSAKAIARRKPTASNQKSQILSLSKKVNRLNTQMRDKTYKVMHKANMSETTMASPSYAVNLCNVPQWVSVFGETDNNREAGKYRSDKMSIDFALSAGTEHESVTWTMFIVTPRNQKVAHDTDNGSGTLSVLVDGTDYTLIEGKALMNLKRWKVHYVTRGATTPIVDSYGGSSEIINEIKPARRYITIRKPSINLRNRIGTWDQVEPDEMNHNGRYHVFLFNNNLSTLEGSPKWSMTVLHQGTTSQ